MKSTCKTCRKEINGSEYWLSASIFRECGDCEKKTEKRNGRDLLVGLGIFGLILLVTIVLALLLVVALMKYILS